jgi:hypothetical protein
VVLNFDKQAKQPLNNPEQLLKASPQSSQDWIQAGSACGSTSIGHKVTTQIEWSATSSEALKGKKFAIPKIQAQ